MCSAGLILCERPDACGARRAPPRVGMPDTARTASRSSDCLTGLVRQDNTSPVKQRSEEHTSELQSLRHRVCRRLLEKKKREMVERLGDGIQPVSLAVHDRNS